MIFFVKIRLTFYRIFYYEELYYLVLVTNIYNMTADKHDIELAGVIRKKDDDKIHITFEFPNENLTDKYKHLTKKILELDHKLIKIISNKKYKEDVDEIKYYRPFYYVYYKNQQKGVLFVKLKIPTRYKWIFKVGSMVEIVATSSTYNFIDDVDKKKNIRGWSLNIKYMNSLIV
jgi:hypothetical protein